MVGAVFGYFGDFRVLKRFLETPIWVLGKVSKTLKSTSVNMRDGRKGAYFGYYVVGAAVKNRFDAVGKDNFHGRINHAVVASPHG